MLRPVWSEAPLAGGSAAHARWLVLCALLTLAGCSSIGIGIGIPIGGIGSIGVGVGSDGRVSGGVSVGRGGVGVGVGGTAELPRKEPGSPDEPKAPAKSPSKPASAAAD